MKVGSVSSLMVKEWPSRFGALIRWKSLFCVIGQLSLTLSLAANTLVIPNCTFLFMFLIAWPNPLAIKSYKNLDGRKRILYYFCPSAVWLIQLSSKSWGVSGRPCVGVHCQRGGGINFCLPVPWCPKRQKPFVCVYRPTYLRLVGICLGARRLN